jgi:biopolymer transport protein TolQ
MNIFRIFLDSSIAAQIIPVQNSQVIPKTSMEELSDNIRLAMERTKFGEVEELEKSLPILSTVVSASPFLGLLGTVWGIMEAFLDIRARGSAHITIVAPGISDALITTVYGLLVAIPALIFYNMFKSRVNSFTSKIDQFINEVFARLRKELILSREK